MNNVAAGLRYGPGLAANAPHAVAAGNFFGMGPVVAAVNLVTQNAQSFELRFFAIDPKTLAVSQMSAKTLQLSLPGTPLFDANMNLLHDPSNDQALDSGRSFFDIQVGNFDRMQPDPAQPGARIRNPNLQVAMLTSTNARPCVVDIFSVDVISGRQPGSQFAFSVQAD